MADLSDVEVALVGAVTSALYPAGIAQANILGKPVRIYRGAPLTIPLAADLANNVANVSIFSTPDSETNVTRWGTVQHITPGTPTLTVTVVGASASFAGPGGAGQLVGVLVAQQAFVYRTQAGDTPALIAAMLAQLIQASRSCWLSGTTITVPGVSSIIARVVADGQLSTEWLRIRQGFRISTWCANPFDRDIICAAIGSALASTSFLTLADNSAGRLRYVTTLVTDTDQDARQYNRALIYNVEYGTSVQQAAPAMLFGDLMWADSPIYS